MSTDVQLNDEYFLDTPVLRRFIAAVRQAIAGGGDVEAMCDALQPHFAKFLADPTWLSEEFASPYEASGMGGGIASWLLFRAGDRSLSLSSLVVPSGSETPVHDHLAWGVVGLYRGEQEETVYERQPQKAGEHRHSHEEHSHEEHSHEELEHVALTVTQKNYLKPGDFYRLIPPEGDIHSVKTTSLEPSISIHLLANDIGCIIRHSYNPTEATRAHLVRAITT
jgi:predicted metal-dependent enzyme (double-stranded beta helix superfamily)